MGMKPVQLQSASNFQKAINWTTEDMIAKYGEDLVLKGFTGDRVATALEAEGVDVMVIYGPEYDMWLDGVHASTSITTIVLEPSEEGDGPGTRLTFTEQGVHLDGVHGPGPQAAAGRKEGTAGLLDSIGALLEGAHR